LPNHEFEKKKTGGGGGGVSVREKNEGKENLRGTAGELQLGRRLDGIVTAKKISRRRFALGGIGVTYSRKTKAKAFYVSSGNFKRA